MRCLGSAASSPSAGRLPTAAATVAPREEPSRESPVKCSRRRRSMPTTPRDPSRPKPKDVPRVGFTCASYLPGHDVHYIPVVKLSPNRSYAPANIDFIGDDFTLRVEDDTRLVQTHNPEALRRLIQELGSACRWYPSFSYACWPDGEVRHWVNLSLEELTPCASREQALKAEWEAWT